MDQTFCLWKKRCENTDDIDAIGALAIDIFAHPEASPEQISCARGVLTEIALSADETPIMLRLKSLKRSLGVG